MPISLSVVIVSWNVRDLLDASLASLLNDIQSLSHEIFVVDNASKDGSAEMVRQKYPAVRLISNNTNVGFPKANNQALALCTGEFVLFLNPDTVTLPGAVVRLIEILQKNPKIGVVGPKLVSQKGELQKVCARPEPTALRYCMTSLFVDRAFPNISWIPSLTYSGWNYSASRVVDGLNGAVMLCRLELCRQVGYLDDSVFMYLEDIDFCKKIRMLGLDIYYCAEVEFIHFEGQSSKQVPVKTRLLVLHALETYVERYQGVKARIAFRVAIICAFPLRLIVALALGLGRHTALKDDLDKFRLSARLEVASALWAIGVLNYQRI